MEKSTTKNGLNISSERSKIKEQTFLNYNFVEIASNRVVKENGGNTREG